MSGWMLNNWVIKWQMKINVNKYRGIHRGRSKSNYPYAMTSCKIAHRKKKKGGIPVQVFCKDQLGALQWSRKGLEDRNGLGKAEREEEQMFFWS